MATVTIAFACGCFKRSSYEQEQHFESTDAALKKAEEMIDDMNNSFCGRHTFGLDARDKEKLIITVENTY